MYKKILVTMALDHGISPQTLEIAKALGGGTGEIIALHVYEKPQGTASVYLDKKDVEAGYENAERRLKEKLADTPEVKPLLVTGHSARTIIDVASEHGVDCIVIGSHQPGLSDYFLGSTASFVVRHAHCAVHVQRDHT